MKTKLKWISYGNSKSYHSETNKRGYAVEHIDDIWNAYTPTGFLIRSGGEQECKDACQRHAVGDTTFHP